MKRCPVCTTDYATGELCPNDGAVLLPREKEDPLLGRILKQSYRIDSLPGSGGMGAVYRARQLSLDRDVAVKVLRSDMQGSEEAIQRFFREAKLASQLSHPNVVSVIDFGNTSDGILFIVLEYLSGQSLKEYVEERGGMALSEIRKVMGQIVMGVSAAHALSIIHRDLKPANILLANLSGRECQAKVLDFGISKSLTSADQIACTQTEMMIGSPGFLSPEQIGAGKHANVRSDVHALGAILYFMVTGRSPFPGESWTVVLSRQISGLYDPIDINHLVDPAAARLLPVIEIALSIAPEDRYPTAIAFLEHLNEVAIETLPEAVATNASPRPKRMNVPFSTRRWTQLAAVASLCILATIGTVSYRIEPPSKSVTPVTDGERGVTATKIRLGMTGAFSGINRELGRGMKTGIGIAIAEQNERGGVHGRMLELTVLDDGYDPERASENVKRLIEEDQVFALVGDVGTATSESVIPYILQRGVLLFGPLSGAATLRSNPPERYIFHLRASYEQEVGRLVRYLVEVRKIPPSAIGVVAQDDSFGEAGYIALAKALAPYQVSKEQLFRASYPKNTLLVDNAVEKLRRSGGHVRVVLFVGSYASSAEFTVKARTQNAGLTVANLSFTGTKLLQQELQERGRQYAEGVIVTQVVPSVDSHSSVVNEYRGALARFKPEEPPNTFSFEGYLVGKLFITGLERVGTDLTTERLIDAMESLKGLDLGLGTEGSLSESNHQLSNSVWGVIFNKEGEPESLDFDAPA